MEISGIQKFTTLDYPEHTACIVFTPGCNFRCGYCHNPEFVLPEKIKELQHSFIEEESFFSFLTKRVGLLDGVVISGGEPTLMPDLLGFMKKVKDMGFLVKLDTNGNRPQVIQKAIEKGLVDYIAMDVKTSFKKYGELVGKFAVPEKIKESIERIKKSGVAYEFRSTLIQETHSQEVLEDMAEMMRGSEKLYLQTFRPGTTLNPLFQTFHAFADSDMEGMKNMFSQSVHNVFIR